VWNFGPLSPFSLAGDMGSKRLVSGRVSAAAWVYDAEFDWVIEESIKLGAKLFGSSHPHDLIGNLSPVRV